ncbi:ferric reductase [Rubrivivax gelatinosus]|uniref:ferredoxin reductase family protein n=1 Tax=Rubrivivax gelatinosus TaxID=28068 RepID=UPI001903C447|nr:ferric reductase-like transmembrane domain-containing protein [Rubrivivax gelatinosus]MBK1614457.1 ferric reductase [Rubrivivax gelatinosus]
MKTIHRTFAGLLLGVSALWLLAEAAALPTAQGVFAWRNLLVQYSGVLGIAVMSVGMLLALRPAWLEERLRGLDKGYRLHKWLGVSGLALSVAHWLFAKGPKWLVQAGWLERPQRGPRPEPADAWLAWLQGMRHPAEEIGEYAFYVMLALITIALIKRFPYRRFFQTHRAMALVYLVLVFHSVVLSKPEYWLQPVGLVLAPLLAVGTVAAFISLARRIGRARRVEGRIEQVEFLQAAQVTAVTVQLGTGWRGHAAGQFAFVTFDENEGAHPFTISSAWAGDGRLRFLIKALGDYTRTLPQTLKAGAAVAVEGPYGSFRFEGEARRQVWIGAGIGVTPFVARLQALAQAPDGRTIDMFHPTTTLDARVIARLEADAQAAGVRLHVLQDARDGRLDGARLRRLVPDWLHADFWFCGPAAFGEALERDLAAAGMPAGRFHRELFEMR